MLDFFNDFFDPQNFQDFLNWLFNGFSEMLKDAMKWVLVKIGELAEALLNAVDFGESRVNDLLSELPLPAQYMISKSGVDVALTLIVSAVLLRISISLVPYIGRAVTGR